MSAFTCWGLHAGTLQMLTSYFQYTLPVNLLLPSYSTVKTLGQTIEKIQTES